MPNPPATDSKPLVMLMASILCFGAISAYFSLRNPSVPGLSSQRIAHVNPRENIEKAFEPQNVAPPVLAESVPPFVAPSAPLPFPAPAPESTVVKNAEPTGKPLKLVPLTKQVAPTKSPITPVKAVDSKITNPPSPPATTTASKTAATVQVREKEPETSSGAIKPVTALPLVPLKPSVVMATKEKAWVRLDDRRTVIVTKGDELPGLGKLLELDAKFVKFEKGTLPVTTE